MNTLFSYSRVALVLLPVAWATAVPATFPKPDPVAAYAEMKLPMSDGRVWRRPIEDWPGAEKRIVQDPAWKQWYETRKAAVDDWMARRHDRAEWVAGWGHEFVSPKDGSFLIWSPDVPGEAGKTLASKSDPKVDVTPAIFRAWVVSFRAVNMGMVQDAAILWR
ncbi:MAG: heparinase, partial [Opitutaceae bacterium]